MTWFSTIFLKNRRFVNFGLAAILFLLITFSPNVVRPLLGNICSSIFFYPFAELKYYIIELQDASRENRLLEKQLTEASLQLEILSEAKRENQRLREVIGFDPPENFRLIPVKIVTLYQNVYPIAAVINKGSRESIKINQPVINRFGLVGKIKEVMPDFATVTLLTDPMNAVSGRVAETREIGIVRFSPDKGMYFDNLPADSDIEPNHLVISSGLGGVYPAGLSLAIVDSVTASRGDILKTVYLKPTVNFFKIDELYVLTGGEQ
ncbi:MAG: rod shape-determining protein MreC [Candidatus Zixiibacteriota bacterium]|nr:MAG: rod shape-determining protein MreC [candidate division Zixibacteria bacterium]HDL04111.1 rod shape-determining protein MreC [candidate division Zixibacteria bacterium]